MTVVSTLHSSAKRAQVGIVKGTSSMHSFSIVKGTSSMHSFSSRDCVCLCLCVQALSMIHVCAADPHSHSDMRLQSCSLCCARCAGVSDVHVCRLSGMFVKPAFFSPLAAEQDALAGNHANTHLAQVPLHPAACMFAQQGCEASS